MTMQHFQFNKGKNDQRCVLICGDFNASVGDIIPNEDPTSVGVIFALVLGQRVVFYSYCLLKVKVFRLAIAFFSVILLIRIRSFILQLESVKLFFSLAVRCLKLSTHGQIAQFKQAMIINAFMQSFDLQLQCMVMIRNINQIKHGNHI